MSRWLVVGALLALAALFRVSAMFYHFISGDDGTVALMAKHILAGEDLPAFFYRQAFMGSLNGFHLVPGLFVFGPSVLLVRLSAVAWSLLFPLGLYVLGRRIYDESVARVALLLAAVPPFLMTYYSTVTEPHFEANTFGVILLALALAALTASTPARRTRSLACLGFIAGLACWTSVKTIVVLGPILLLLLARDPLLPARRDGWLLGAGFALGSLPAWLFYLTQPDPGQGSLGSARRFLVVGLNPSWPQVWEFLVNVLPLPIGSYYFGPFTPLRLAGLILCCAIYLAAVAIAGVEAVRSARDGARTRRAWGLWALLLTLVATFAALYLSGFNIINDDSRGRYVLPAYIPLFLLLAAGIQRLARWSRPAAATVLAFVIIFNIWTNLDFMWPLHPDERARRDGMVAARQALTRHLRDRPPPALLVADERGSVIWQFLLDLPVVAALFSDPYVPSAVAADAAGRVAILAPRHEERLSLQLDALGARRTETRWGDFRLYEDVHVPPRAYRLVPRAGWRVPGEDATPPAVADGDLGTVWPSRRLDASEAGQLVVDLGRTWTVARVVLWPTALTDLIVPLEVAGSLDGTTWERLGPAPERVGRPAFVAGHRPLVRPRNGWLDLVVPPHPMRYLRVRPVTAGSVGVGMVGELFLYEAVDGPPADDASVDDLLGVLRARGVTRLLADPVISARVILSTKGQVATVPANGVLNNYGLSPPLLLFARLRFRETDAAVVAAEDAAELRERLDAAGFAVSSQPVGSHVLVQPVGPLPTSARCRATDWRVTGEIPDADGRGARYVVEGRLPEPMHVATVRFEHPRVSTRNVRLVGIRLSDDGAAWRPAKADPVTEWVWAGRTLFAFSAGVTEVALGGAPGRFVRVELHLLYRGQGAIVSLCARGDR